MKVVFTAAAEEDLESIGDWIAQRNPLRALSFVRELRDACEALAAAPERYSRVLRYEHTGVRRRPYGNYLIFYRVSDADVEILHVLHGAQHYEAILSPDD